MNQRDFHLNALHTLSFLSSADMRLGSSASFTCVCVPSVSRISIFGTCARAPFFSLKRSFCVTLRPRSIRVVAPIQRILSTECLNDVMLPWSDILMLKIIHNDKLKTSLVGLGQSSSLKKDSLKWRAVDFFVSKRRMVEYSYFEVRGLFHFRKKSIYKRGLFTHFGSNLAIKSASKKCKSS